MPTPLPVFVPPTVDLVFADSSLSYSGQPATEFSGLDHLKGREVVVVADGSVIRGKVVSNDGKIVLDSAAMKVDIGLGYVSKMRTMRLEYDAQGTPQGRKKKISKVFVRVESTRGLMVGPDENHLVPMKFHDGLDLAKPTALFTGDKSVNIEPKWGTEGQLYFEQADPVPMNILAIIPEIETSATA